MIVLAVDRVFMIVLSTEGVHGCSSRGGVAYCSEDCPANFGSNNVSLFTPTFIAKQAFASCFFFLSNTCLPP